tara:strand:- start:2427 stop:4082 length:1656 start_codon:yes stop_codon:yes gene_type:complete
MFRPFLFFFSSILLGFLGWSIPVYWKLVNSQLLEAVGEGTPSLVDSARNLVQLDRLGAASILLDAAESLQVSDTKPVRQSIEKAVELFPEYGISGGPDPYFDQIQRIDPQLGAATRSELIPNLIPSRTRTTLSSFLENSRSTSVKAIIGTREMAGTRQFMPVYSSAGQPLEATIMLGALIMQGSHYSPEIAATIRTLSDNIDDPSAVADLERIYFALFSLGKRMNWNQLVEMLPFLEDSYALEQVAAYARNYDKKFSWIYSAILLRQASGPVIRYLDTYPEEALDDLGQALAEGQGALEYLLEQMEKVQDPSLRVEMAGYIPWLLNNPVIMVSAAQIPTAFLFFKGLFISLAAFCLTRFGLRAFPLLFRTFSQSCKPPLIVSGLRTITLTLILSFLIILIMEPGVFRQSRIPQTEVRLEWAFQDTVESLFTPTERKEIMDQITIITISIFFLMQLAVYMAGLIKLTEIRKMDKPTPLKLELLENEDQLFDSGLYLGLAGTVFSLIFLAIGVVQASLMAAYSSTLFGIIFVAILKVFHVRPFRKNLLLNLHH